MALPAERRLRRGADITAVVRRGSRARNGGLVVHGLRRPEGGEPQGGGPQGETAVGPRVAFVAPRTVGNAVHRNRTRRRLQAQVEHLVTAGALTADVDLVLRLLPASSGSESAELGRQLRAALRRLGVLTGEHP